MIIEALVIHYISERDLVQRTEPRSELLRESIVRGQLEEKNLEKVREY